MIKIDKELLKRLLAITDAHDYLYEYRDVIECLNHDNGFDKDMVYNFLQETEELTDKILQEEEELDDWLGIEQEKREWLDD